MGMFFYCFVVIVAPLTYLGVPMTWRAIRRIIHLPGGLRLLNRIGPSVEFDPGDGRGSREVSVLQHYDALFVAAAGLRLFPMV